MRTPREAITEIVGRIRTPAGKESVRLRDADGRVLAERVASDVDLPPFEKSAMDGFAVRSADFGGDGGVGRVELRCVGESRAGQPFAGDVPAGACVEIFTGAELPPDCDAVVMVERSRREGDRVTLEDAVAPGANVSHRGEILREGREVAVPGLRLAPADLAVLAAVGCDPVPVYPRPRVSILTTGDELVSPRAVPGPGQIREGNTLFLAAACERAGATVLRAGVLPDDPAALAAGFGAALEESDAVITTGGVSVGKYDLVGAAFEELGVQPVLHKVAIKPGKPIWFGLRGEVPVFGLPGNPVSSLLGFEVFVRPALARMAGAGVEEQGERLGEGTWAGPRTATNARQQNLPSRVERGPNGVERLVPLPWRGSADIVGVSRATAFAIVPPGQSLEPGQRIRYRPLG